MYVLPEVRDGVVFLCALFKREMKFIGTAFFVGVPAADKTKGFMHFVVTALHVVAKAEQKSDDGVVYCRVNTPDGSFKFVRVRPENWRKPDQAAADALVDVAVAAWNIDLPKPLVFTSIATAATAKYMQQEALGIGDDVYLAGLFVNHVGKQRNEPIVRVGTLAAMPEEPIQSQAGPLRGYLIESRSVGGLSGSPVFLSPGLFKRVDGGTKLVHRTGVYGAPLLGVMHGHWHKQAVDLGLDQDQAEYINMGIAIVSPVERVLELLRSTLQAWGKLDLVDASAL